jgi:hypothetical protein
VTSKREAPRAITKVDERERSVEEAMSQYRKEQEAISKRTAELREMRLAYERKHGKPKKARAARVAESATRASLSDWFEEQEKFGRET